MRFNSMILFVLVFLSCQKTDFPTLEAAKIVGEWEWVVSSGGIAGSTIRAKDVDFTKQIIFKENGKFRKCADNQKDGKGSFEISYVTANEYELELENEIGPLNLNFWGQDTISLYLKNCADCFADTYVRK